MAHTNDLMYAKLQTTYDNELSLGDNLAQFAIDNPTFAGHGAYAFYVDALETAEESTEGHLGDLANRYWSL